MFKRGMHQYYAKNAGEDDHLLEDPQKERKNIEFVDLVDYLTEGLDEREKIIFVTYCLENKKKFRQTCRDIEVPYQIAVTLLQYKILPIIRTWYLVDFSPLDKTKVSQDPSWILEQREEVYRRACREKVRKDGDRKAQVRKKYLANIGSRLLGRDGSTNSGSSEADLLERSEKNDSEGADLGHQGIGTDGIAS